MIELIFVLIIIEIVFGVYIILFMDKKIRNTEALNDKIIKSKFKGNLTELKLNLKILNTKLHAIIEEKKAQEKANKIEMVSSVVNSVLLGYSFIKFFNRKKTKKH